MHAVFQIVAPSKIQFNSLQALQYFFDMGKNFDLTGKTAIVTGGGSGIGAAISEMFAANGAEVFIFEINADNAKAVQERIAAAGGKSATISCNVADQAGVMQAFEQVVEKSGKLDILVNNAGIAHIGTVETTEEADFDKVYQVNVKGVYNCLKAAVKHMKTKGGSIVNMASIVSTVGIKDRFAYSMSKGAVLTMTYSTAKDFLAQGIRCNAIAPARIHTPFVDGFLAKNYPGKEQEMFDKLSKTQPIGRMGKAEEVAAMALFLCSDEAGFITGCNFPVDGGFTTLNN